ncbi:MAG: beta-lactamase family protein, partial [Acidobacteria bacterium]|nr:beta-lactamase family protein [Acidobacteriota bacterium]
MRTCTAFVTALLTAIVSGQTQDASVKAPPAQFTDSQRRAKLEAAFPEIDRIFQQFTEQAHVPGASWGIVVDGELAHTGVAGLRDVAAKAPVERDTVFRIASMTKSFT